MSALDKEKIREFFKKEMEERGIDEFWKGSEDCFVDSISKRNLPAGLEEVAVDLWFGGYGAGCEQYGG